jgi:hypothetical protein
MQSRQENIPENCVQAATKILFKEYKRMQHGYCQKRHNEKSNPTETISRKNQVITNIIVTDTKFRSPSFGFSSDLISLSNPGKKERKKERTVPEIIITSKI